MDTLVVSGRCDLKKSDILAYEEKAYLVLAVDNAGDLGVEVNGTVGVTVNISEIVVLDAIMSLVLAVLRTAIHLEKTHTFCLV